MSNEMPGKHWIKAVQHVAWLAIAFFLLALVINITRGAFDAFSLALVVVGAACIPIAWNVNRFINRNIYDYEHAYDDPQWDALMKHHQEALTSDERRPTDQPE